MNAAHEQFADLYQDYTRRLQALLLHPRELNAAHADPRFADAAWREGNYPLLVGVDRLNAEMMRRLAALAPGDKHARERLRFAIEQWVEATSPANFLATNPQAQRRVLESAGQSLRRGIEHLIHDLARGRITQSDEQAFVLGRDLARSQGAVVYRNALIEVIQYLPRTATVGTRPLLIVPPCINKFYVLDLREDNSFVQHALGASLQVFMISWRNPDASMTALDWDHYLEEGVIAAIRVVQDIADHDDINVLGFCIGGTLACTALAALAAKGIEPLASLSLLTTLLDFSEPGPLGVFTSEEQVGQLERRLGSGGLLNGGDLAAVFSALRPGDLVWNYVVQNYLLGERPPAFDLLYWNADSTNLPGPMFVAYLRGMYRENALCQPGRLSCLGEAIDLASIQVPAYVFAAREDHIVPWKSAYRSGLHLGGPMRFVLGASGHIAGTINPAGQNRRSFRVPGPTAVDGGTPEDPQSWLAASREIPGSWWSDWSQWVRSFAGRERKAPGGLGNRRFPPLDAAPGRYVLQKAPTLNTSEGVG